MKTSYLLLFTILFTNSTFSQSIELDNSYANAGINKLNIHNSTDNQCLLSKVQTDDKVVLCGSIITSNYTEYPYLTRVLVDGTLDSTFNGSGILIDSNFIDFTPYTMAIQSDGKIIVAGQIISFVGAPGGEVSGLIVRYNSNGVLDSTFNNVGSIEIRPTVNNYFGRSIALSNNDIYLSGYVYLNSIDYDVFCAKINTSGTLDNTFGINGLVELDFGGLDISRGVSVQNNGKVIVSGYEQNSFNPILARLNADGTLDAGFSTAYQNSNPQQYGAIYQTIIDDNDLITGIGFSYDTGTGLINTFVSRINTDGSLDVSFASNGELNFNITGEDTYGIYGAYYTDDKLIVVGNSGDASNFDMKLFALGIKADGAIDSNFVQNGVYIDADSTGYNLLNAVNLNSNNKIIATGYSEELTSIHKPIITQFNIVEGVNSIANIFAEVHVLIYPNPVTDNHIFIENNQNENLLFNITTINGQVVSEFKEISASQKLEEPIQFPRGIYLLNLHTEQGVFIKSNKIMIR